jgi:serine protease Do
MKRLLLVALFLAGSAFAADIRVIVQRARPAVVEIGVFDQTGQLVATGTGFFISPDGTLLTNYHVIADATSILARDHQKKTYHLKGIVAASPESDVAELQFDVANVPYLTLGSTSSLVEGERILAIGNPEGLEGTVSEGIVSAFRDNRTTIQISAAISHGSSGSPVIDVDSGQVIGIATSILREGQSPNFAFLLCTVNAKIYLTLTIRKKHQPRP